jgi:hypothetical protein
LKLPAAILWDGLRELLRLKPYYIPMVGSRGELAVGASDDAQKMKEFLSGGDLNTLWRNEVAPRALLSMARFKPYTFAPRVNAPVLVCAAEDDLAPVAVVAELADLAPRGRLRVFPGSHFDFYLDPSFRDRVLEEQLTFLQDHLGVP